MIETQRRPARPPLPCEADTTVHTLSNGVRVVVIRQPHLSTAVCSVFVRTGSRHEPPSLNGISHFVEHMAFKGTATRDCHRINLDAERLGADVNAHTDKDHTAYHMQGLAEHAGRFVHMLADIVLQGVYPEPELAREREVILQEFLEDADDPVSTANKLFDQASYGTHGIAQPVIGTRTCIERLTRGELLAYVQSRYSGANIVVGVAGGVDADAVLAEVQAAFGEVPPGEPHVDEAARYVGGSRMRRLPGNSQSHVVLGFPIASAKEDYHAGVVAAALFGEGMSSPLMREIRENRGLVYYASCSADVTDVHGQFVIEASTTPDHLEEFFTEVTRLLSAHAHHVDPVDLERARNQIAVRTLRAQENLSRRLEDAALDLYTHGRVRSRAEVLAGIEAVTADDVRDVFRRMLEQTPALAVAGKIGKATSHHFFDILQGRRDAVLAEGLAS